MTVQLPQSVEADPFADYIALHDVPERLKAIRRVSENTVYRWAQKGLHGIRLRYDLIGGKKFTTAEWLKEFFRDSAEAERTKEDAEDEVKVTVGFSGGARSAGIRENRHGI